MDLCERDDEILVSVWMITYNHDRYIRQAIDSVLTQVTDFKFEIVIGDDCSSDNTRDILLEYKRRNPDLIKLIFHKENIGMIRNQNVTFSACSGKYIAMLEGDDYWLDSNKLQMQVESIESFPGLKLCFHSAVETKYGRIISRRAKSNCVLPIRDFILGGGYYCSTPSLLVAASVVKSLPDFLDSSPAGDYYIQMLCAIAGGGGVYIDRPMSAYRVDSTGSWSESVKDFDRKQKFRIRTVDMLTKMVEYVSNDWSFFLNKKRNDVLLLIAFDYLIHDNNEKFFCYFKLVDGDKYGFSYNYYIVDSFKRYPLFLKLFYYSIKGLRRFTRGLNSKFK